MFDFNEMLDSFIEDLEEAVTKVELAKSSQARIHTLEEWVEA